MDAIREFEILSSTYDATFGRSGGAQVNVALKSGTNEFHGTAYEFLRNASLDARNFFAPGEAAAPRYQRNQFGFSVGGTDSKKPYVLFCRLRGRRVREGITQVANVPTAVERAGDFSQSLFAHPVDPFSTPVCEWPDPRRQGEPHRQSSCDLYPLPNRMFRGKTTFLRRFFAIAMIGSTSLGSFPRREVQPDRPVQLFRSRPVRALLRAQFCAYSGLWRSLPRRAQNFMLGEDHSLSRGSSTRRGSPSTVWRPAPFRNPRGAA